MVFAMSLVSVSVRLTVKPSEANILSQSLEIRVIIIDSHPMLREGLRTTVNQHPLCRVVAESGDIAGAQYACTQHPHDVVLINFSMAPSEAITIVKDFKQAFPDTRIIMGQVDANRKVMSELCNVGVTGFLSPTAEAVEYTSATISVWGGGLYFSADIAQVLMNATDANGPEHNTMGLTARELDVLELLAGGYCNKEIANMRNISIRTVETHRLNIRKKTRANTLSDLVRIAKELGLQAMGSGPSITSENAPLLSYSPSKEIS